jgi:hypothetical protein
LLVGKKTAFQIVARFAWEDRVTGFLRVEWGKYSDAYGPATILGAILTDEIDTILSNDDPHDLWGRLCHQGQIYDASYVAVPFLLRIQLMSTKPSWNVIALIAAIHIAHVDGCKPFVPSPVLDEYLQAVESLPRTLARFLIIGIDELSCRAALAACAAASENTLLAKVLLDLTPELARKFEREWRFAE